jgi:hypothetical protein
MTPRQIVNVDLLKAASAEFATMRRLAMQFAGLLRGGDCERSGRRLPKAPDFGTKMAAPNVLISAHQNLP